MSRTLVILGAAVVLLAPIHPVEAQGSRIEQSLSGRIDELIEKRLAEAKIPASGLADDAEFLRRVYLDLTGRIPTHEQTTAFLGSTEPDKRARLIDELLGRPEYGLHFATIWRDLLVDRGMENNQARQGHSWEFVTWLAEGFNKDRGWNESVSAMLTAAGEAKKNPALLLILANRMNNFPRPADLASTTGRLFMGIQLRCAQCHDHPYVDEWGHDDFWGLAAFFGQLRDHGQEPDGTSRNPAFYDQPHPDAKKETTYLNRLKRAGLIAPQTGAQIAIPNGSDPTKIARVVPAKFFLGEKPEMAEAKSYRERLASWLAAPENPYFARAAANRLWAHFFARGLAPVDDIRPRKAASHPPLLALLEEEFKAAGFKQKHLIRGICNSRTYQRTSRPRPENAMDRELFSHMAIKLLSPDQMIDSLAVAAGRPATIGKNRDQQNAPFVTGETDADPTEFSHGLPQFLLRMNGGAANTNAPIVGKLTTGKAKEEAIRNLYLAVLSRALREAELHRMLAFLDKAANSNQGYRDIYWVLLNSAEFVLNR